MEGKADEWEAQTLDWSSYGRVMVSSHDLKLQLERQLYSDQCFHCTMLIPRSVMPYYVVNQVIKPISWP